MSTLVELPGFQKTFETPVANRRDEAVWQAWVAKGRAREWRGSATRVKIVKLVSAVMLLATAAFASNLASFDVIIRFVVALGAVVVMFQEFHRRHYAVAAVFGVLALLYNPVEPVFGFAGDWQRVAVAASAIPFIASLARRGTTTGDLHV